MLAKVSEAFAEARHENFALPAEVKALYQKKSDELSWKNADALRGIVRRRAELAETLVLETAVDVRRLADALAAGGAPGGDVVGGAREVAVAGVPLRKGARVEVPPATRQDGGPANGTDPRPQAKRARPGQAAGPRAHERCVGLGVGSPSLTLLCAEECADGASPFCARRSVPT